MPALATRREARERLIQTMMAALDRIIPEDESKPLKGTTFGSWEDQTDAFKQAVIPTILEERAALEDNARLENPGHCPLCGSSSVYLEKQTTKPEVRAPDGPVVIENSTAGAAPVAVLFPPQNRDWALPSEANLTPHAAERLCREAANKAFEDSARSLNRDWKTDLDGKQIQRWSEALGRGMVKQRDRQSQQQREGRYVQGPVNAPQLLVIGLDGGRYQSREKNPDTDSRWREDKVVSVSSYIPGDGKEDPDARKPVPLVTTHLATARDASELGVMARVEAERRGYRQAVEVIGMGDGGNWIDPLFDREFHLAARIIDWCHASEHLWDCAKAVHGLQTPAAASMAEKLEAWLWDGKVEKVIEALTDHSAKLGDPQSGDPPQHPRRVLQQNVGYFTRHKDHMRYPEYRAKGWPIGSGVTEAAVKQFNKRVKGTEQFWEESGIEPILCLRAAWTSQDERWDRYWESRPAYVN